MFDSASFSHTQMYRPFLAPRNIMLEGVGAWSCGTHLVDEFRAQSYLLRGTFYLLMIRHIFAEMESLVKRFALFAANGELDREFPTADSDQERRTKIPSLIEGKHAYSSGAQEI